MCTSVGTGALIPYPGTHEDFAFQVAAKGLARPTVVVKLPGEAPEALKRYHTLCTSILEATNTSSPMRDPLIHRAIRDLGALGFYRDGLSLALSRGFSIEFTRSILFGWFKANPVVATTYVYTLDNVNLRDVALSGLTYFFCSQPPLPNYFSLPERQAHTMVWLQRALKTAATIQNIGLQQTSLRYIFTYFQDDLSLEFLFENYDSEEVFALASPLLTALLNRVELKCEAPILASCFPVGERRDQLVMPLCQKAFLDNDLEIAVEFAELFSKKHERNRALFGICRQAYFKKDRWAFSRAMENLSNKGLLSHARRYYTKLLAKIR
ncbi:MAG: hypothetical protein JSR76_05715 [Verrucomicrobia bacterium]|nr:hypothetical protein [Verrucomicrobiota bacterium]